MRSDVEDPSGHKNPLVNPEDDYIRDSGHTDGGIDDRVPATDGNENRHR